MKVLEKTRKNRLYESAALPTELRRLVWDYAQFSMWTVAKLE
jgi:hypothetical protein